MSLVPQDDGTNTAMMETTDVAMENTSTGAAPPSEEDVAPDGVMEQGASAAAGGDPTGGTTTPTSDAEWEPPTKKPRMEEQEEKAQQTKDVVSTADNKEDKPPTNDAAGEQQAQAPSSSADGGTAPEGTNTPVDPTTTTTATGATTVTTNTTAAASNNNRTTGGSTTSTSTMTYRKKTKYFLYPLAIGEKDASGVSTPAVTAAAQPLVFGKGGQLWNAHLRAAQTTEAAVVGRTLSSRSFSLGSSHSHKKITTFEILQQAQERLVFPPTRFPPRESPLHQIFTPTSQPRGDRRIFGPLEECYREMLEQDAGLEDALRKEYKALFKKNNDNSEVLLRRRVGQIFVQGRRLQHMEQDLLTKLKAGLDGSTLG